MAEELSLQYARPALALIAMSLTLTAAAAPERVRISTIVTDRQGRTIAGLSAKDFEVREDGVLQTLEGVEARPPAVRRIAILLDEFHVDAADESRVRDTVRAFVAERLRPEDALVVLKPLDPLSSIKLTVDRASAERTIDSFEGRNGVYEPRNPLEEETMGRAPSLVEAGRAQVVLSALRALASQLGSAPGRSAILVVTNGFTPVRRMTSRGLPDANIVQRFANRYDVPIYAFDPRESPPAAAGDGDTIDRLAAETGGATLRGKDLATSLARVSLELDAGYTLTYTPAHGDDGKYHPVQVSLVRNLSTRADARARAGYISPIPPELRRALYERGPILPTRLLRRSPIISVWSGITRIDGPNERIAVTWQPAGGAVKPARVTLKATTFEGKVLFEGSLQPVRVAEAADEAMPDRAEFDAPTGRVQLDMTILDPAGRKLDVDARDIDVPGPKGNTPVLLPPIMIATQSARAFREVAADVNAAPDPSRQFRRTERLVIRVPAYASGRPLQVTGRLLNRTGQLVQQIDAMSDTANGVMQFDLPLAPLAPGDYFLQFTVQGESGTVDQRVPFKITG
jgi:VWFA-related protein